MRAYARDLAFHPSALSRILAGKQELTFKGCCAALEKLRLEATDKASFVESILRDRLASERAELYRMCGLEKV